MARAWEEGIGSVHLRHPRGTAGTGREPILGSDINVSVIIWMEMYPGSREPRNTTKLHLTTSLTKETYWEGTKPGGWLPLLGQEIVEI